MIPIIYNTISKDELILNENETARRLQAEKGFKSDLIDQCLNELKNAVSCKLSAVITDIFFYDDGYLDLGFGRFQSFDLSKNLKGCKKAYIFAVTLGMDIDRLLYRYSLLSPSKHFIFDALASSLAEAGADRAEEIIRGGIVCSPRFSPGYGDLPLEIQPDILKLLNAGKLLGITINNALLMSPGKSVTAIMGIKNE
ncbi:MAG: Vitamin B12 dependent methionine synthase activation subunit [Ruminococcaceae bacterium]|nr:Vitamin B12 dependent methionine synthase activation subunit [Oscillospiraceae bacterium]